jgi:hypothetical protein
VPRRPENIYRLKRRKNGGQCCHFLIFSQNTLKKKIGDFNSKY